MKSVYGVCLVGILAAVSACGGGEGFLAESDPLLERAPGDGLIVVQDYSDKGWYAASVELKQGMGRPLVLNALLFLQDADEVDYCEWIPTDGPQADTSDPEGATPLDGGDGFELYSPFGTLDLSTDTSSPQYHALQHHDPQERYAMPRYRGYTLASHGSDDVPAFEVDIPVVSRMVLNAHSTTISRGDDLEVAWVTGDRTADDSVWIMISADDAFLLCKYEDDGYASIPAAVFDDGRDSIHVSISRQHVGELQLASLDAPVATWFHSSVSFRVQIE